MASTKSTGRKTKKSPGKKASAAKRTSAKPKKKPRTKKPAKKKNPGTFQELKKTVLGIAILIAVCLTAAMLIDLFFKSHRPVPPKSQTAQKTPPAATPQVPAPPPRPELNAEPAETKAPKVIEPKIITRVQGLKEKEQASEKNSISKPGTPVPKEGSAIVYEVYDDVTPTPAKKIVPPKKVGSVPLIAIIIDDIGYDKRLAMGLFNIDKNITFSILPFSPAGKQLAHSLSAKGAELMLHLPMEPTQYPKVNPGPGALLSSMSPDELLTQLQKNIQAVPGTVGANNHMGSRLTADSDKMNQIFTVLKKNNLFFIDSRTSAKSKGEQSARMFRLKFSHRDVFLDNFQNVEYISGQIEKLIKQAHAHGSAIGIGHPHQTTLDALKQELPKIRGRVRLVPASRLVHVPQI